MQNAGYADLRTTQQPSKRSMAMPNREPEPRNEPEPEPDPFEPEPEPDPFEPEPEPDPFEPEPEPDPFEPEPEPDPFEPVSPLDPAEPLDPLDPTAEPPSASPVEATELSPAIDRMGEAIDALIRNYQLTIGSTDTPQTFQAIREGKVTRLRVPLEEHAALGDAWRHLLAQYELQCQLNERGEVAQQLIKVFKQSPELEQLLDRWSDLQARAQDTEDFQATIEIAEGLARAFQEGMNMLMGFHDTHKELDNNDPSQHSEFLLETLATGLGVIAASVKAQLETLKQDRKLSLEGRNDFLIYLLETPFSETIRRKASYRTTLEDIIDKRGDKLGDDWSKLKVDAMKKIRSKKWYTDRKDFDYLEGLFNQGLKAKFERAASKLINRPDEIAHYRKELQETAEAINHYKEVTSKLQQECEVAADEHLQPMIETLDAMAYSLADQVRYFSRLNAP